MEPKDSNGNVPAAGDSVFVIKTLKVKGSSNDIKKGTVFKNIRLTEDDEGIEGEVEGSTIVLKNCFLKKKYYFGFKTSDETIARGYSFSFQG